MGKSLFQGLKKEWDSISDEEIEQNRLKKKEKKAEKAEKKQREKIDKIDRATEEVQNLLGSDEEVLYVYTFWNDKMIVTNKKLIYIDLKVAKNKTFAMIPHRKITSYSLLVPTGLSVKGKLKIFTGGDTPSLEIQSVLNEGMNEFCRILADII